MLVARTNELELLPDPSEPLRGVMAFLLAVPLLVDVALDVGFKLSTRRRDDLEARIERLKKSLLEERDRKR